MHWALTGRPISPRRVGDWATRLVYPHPATVGLAWGIHARHCNLHVFEPLCQLGACHHQVVNYQVLLNGGFMRFSSDTARTASVAVPPNGDPPPVMQLMLQIWANTTVQCIFQLGQVRSTVGGHFHSRHARVMLPVARVCLVPVVTIMASEMWMPPLVTSTWDFFYSWCNL